MDEAVSRPERRRIVDQYLTEVSLLAQELCPEAKVEATTERYEDEDGHVRIVMTVNSNPVGAGLVASLARPGGNITGLAGLTPELSGKRLELLKEAVPTTLLFQADEVIR